MLRALTLVDVIAQLNQDSGGDVPYDPSEVVNALIADEETLGLADTSTATTITNYPANLIADAGPVGYWRLDDPLSATTACDSSPWASTAYPKVIGSVSGGVTFQAAGAMPGSYGATFDGTSGFVEIADTDSLSRVGDLTIEMWIKPAAMGSRTLISKGTTGEYHLRLNSSGSITLLMGPSYAVAVIPGGQITTGSWWHVAVVRRAVDQSVAGYVNGVAVYSGGYATPPTATSNVVRIGAASPTAGSYYSGVMDEVAVYARALTPAQVAARYAWATAADCGSTPYGSARYGRAAYPPPGAPAGAIYGDPSSLYGSVTYS